MTDKPDIWAQLAAPFDPDQVKFKVQTLTKDKKKGMVVAYITARDLMDRFDTVLGASAWSDFYKPIRVEDGKWVVECTITVNSNGDVIEKSDVGGGTDPKDAYSDAFKRCGVKFGPARYLYRLPKMWAPVDNRGRITNEEFLRTKYLKGEIEPADVAGHHDENGGTPKQPQDDNATAILLISNALTRLGVKSSTGQKSVVESLRVEAIPFEAALYPDLDYVVRALEYIEKTLDGKDFSGFFLWARDKGYKLSSQKNLAAALTEFTT